jgi:hypothetical protein
MCVKALQDKGASTREKVLAALASALEELPPLTELDDRCLLNNKRINHLFLSV